MQEEMDRLRDEIANLQGKYEIYFPDKNDEVDT